MAALLVAVLALGGVAAARAADVRVQDIARLQGQRTNKLLGYGLVVGLNGTGDGEKYLATMRALMRLHERYHAPVLTVDELRGNKSVAIVAVEATIPEFGAGEGQALDVVVSAVGPASSLKGGQLLTTPLQYALFDAEDPDTQHILALAGGPVRTPTVETPTRGVIDRGATLEADFLYNFVQDGQITLVLNDEIAGWPYAHVVVRALNHELTAPFDPSAASAKATRDGTGGSGLASDDAELATATSPKNVVVRIPQFELANPAGFISRVLQTPLFMLPQQAARVTINRATGNVAFTGSVTVSPTVLQIPGLGTVEIGKPADAAEADAATGAAAPRGAAAEAAARGPVPFSEVFKSLTAARVTPAQLIDAIENLHRTGTLHAQLQYE